MRGQSHCPDLAGILRHNGIRRDEGQVLDLSLCEKNAVEGIFVDRRKIERRNGMFTRNGKLMPTIIEKSAAGSRAASE